MFDMNDGEESVPSGESTGAPLSLALVFLVIVLVIGAAAAAPDSWPLVACLLVLIVNALVTFRLLDHVRAIRADVADLQSRIKRRQQEKQQAAGKADGHRQAVR